MTEPSTVQKHASIREVVARVVGHLRGRVVPIVELALAFKLLNFLLLAPLASATLRLALRKWGRCSVGNFEIAQFLASGPGVIALVLGGSVALATLYLEIAGLLELLSGRSASVRGVILRIGLQLAGLVRLALRQVVFYLFLAIPVALVAAFTYRLLWSGRDINGLLILRPPIFWTGVGIAGSALAIAGLIGLRQAIAWSLALQTLLFEPATSPGKALTTSQERVARHLWLVVSALGLWFLVETVLSTLVAVGVDLGSEWILGHAGSSLRIALPVTALLLAGNTVLATLVSIFGEATFAATLLALHESAGGQTVHKPMMEPPATLLGTRRSLIAGALIAMVVAAVSARALLGNLALTDAIEITAHRGASEDAPENTVAAIKAAIAAGADWAEIDVLRTKDDALVVMHDTDLARSGGPPRAVKDSTLAEIQALDVGSLFGTAFRGERIPTFDQILDAAGDQIGLTIELKPQGKDDVAPLTDAVLTTLARRKHPVRLTRLCSQSYEAMKRVKTQRPDLPTGYIAGAAIGDLTGLEVDFLMVNLPLATRHLVDRASLRNLAIHAWTVNDPNALSPLLDNGIACVITDRPKPFRERLEEIRALSPVERLLLRARDTLAR